MLTIERLPPVTRAKILILPLSLLCTHANGADSSTDVRSATQRGLTMVMQAASRWQQNKTCFSCHHQTLAMLAATEAERAGFPLETAWLKSQADTTHHYFEKRIDELNEGQHIPGGAGTTAYGFWALSLDNRPADATTTAMVHYLLQIQGVKKLTNTKPEIVQPSDGRWIASCQRPPIQGSQLGDTVLVLIGLEHYATPDQRSQLAAARANAEKFIAGAKLNNHQDRLWRLWGLYQLGGDAAPKHETLAAILKAQRPDGGWSQNDADTSSDAYSTAQTLFMLCQTGFSKDATVMQQARDYLLETQLDDGSWLVESRLEDKALRYFENGDPHGEHQFLSTAATCWATAALAQFLLPQ